jgi:CheY-like chemotaxis protein
LAADDNLANQLVINHMLTKLGCTCEICSNGEEVLALLAEERFDLILLDQFIPVMGGPETSRRIRAKGINIKTVAMTASILPEDEEECLTAGMDAFLSKPVTLRKLADTPQKVCTTPTI